MEINSVNNNEVEKRAKPDDEYGYFALSNNKSLYSMKKIPISVKYL
jgi:hypothetical protein